MSRRIEGSAARADVWVQRQTRSSRREWVAAKRVIWTMFFLAMVAPTIFGQGSNQPGGNPGRNRGFVKTLKFSVYFRSMAPATVTVEEGPYDIQIDASMFTGEVDFELEEEGKIEKRLEKKPGGRAKHLLPVDLKPGRYVLAVRGNADRWRSAIVVTKK